MQNSTKKFLAVVGLFVVAAGGGYFGAGLRGGSGGGGGGADNGAFLESIKDRGELRVGVAIAPPMTVQEANGTLGGPNLVPLQALAEEMDVKLTAVPAEWKNIVAGLQADRYDFAANLDATVERALSIQFTEAVYEYQAVFVVKADSPFNTSDQIRAAGGPVGTPQGTAPEKALADSKIPTMGFDNYSNALAATKAGRVIAEFADLPTAESQAQADPTVKIVVPDPPIYEASANYGVPASADARSLQVVNIAIQRARQSGELTRAYEAVNYLEIDNLGDLEKNSAAARN
jgi:ABC-type amino acid transport substrate-binding protein